MSGPDWSTISPGLIQLFSALALPNENAGQSPPWSAEWRDRARKATPTGGPMKGTTLTLKITSVQRIGEDDQRSVYVVPAVPPALPTPWDGSLQESIYGLRRVTLNLQASMSEVSDDSWALGLLERISTRLSRKTTVEALQSLNVAIIDIGTALDISFRQTQHMQSRASMDVILCMVTTDTDPVPTGWIQSVIIQSNLQEVNGVTLPVPPNYTQTVSS